MDFSIDPGATLTEKSIRIAELLADQALMNQWMEAWIESPAATEARLMDRSGVFGLKLIHKFIAAVRRMGREEKRRRSPAPVFLPVDAEVEVLDRLQTAGRSIKSSAYNLGTILRHDSRWMGRFRFNDFSKNPEILEQGTWRPLIDMDDHATARWMAHAYSLDFSSGTVAEQLSLVAYEKRMHPVRDYLDTLVWDGHDRLSPFLSTYFGAQASPLNAEVARMWLISCVARIYEPGCKVDTLPVFIGPQGAKKSSSIKALVPDPTWYSDSELPLRNSGPDKYQVLRGKWIFEVGEFDRFERKTESADLKAYVSSEVDSYRMSYGRRYEDFPRQVVFAGTANPYELFSDPTGGRRMMPVVCGACDPDGLARDRDFIWAQAVAAYRSGERWYLTDSQLLTEMAQRVESHSIGDAWEGVVQHYLKPRKSVTLPEVLEQVLQISPRDQDAQAVRRVRAILQRQGWQMTGKRTNSSENTGPKVWAKAGAAAAISVPEGLSPLP